MTDERERWALILGASSGMGEATSRALAARGYRILGVHLDFRAAIAHVDEVKEAIAAAGSEAHVGALQECRCRSDAAPPRSAPRGFRR